MSLRAVWLVLAIAGLILQVLVLHNLLRGSYRRFPFLLVYCAALLFISVFNTLQFFGGAKGAWTAASQQYYWIGEMVLQGLIYAITVSFVFQAMGEGPGRDVMRRYMVLAALAIAAASLYFFHDSRTVMWMTRVTLYLSFLSTLFCLILWLVLLRMAAPEKLLLLVTGGLGMQMAGQSVGHALREMAGTGAVGRSLMHVGNLIIVLCHLLCLYIWWQAFRHARASSTSPVVN